MRELKVAIIASLLTACAAWAGNLTGAQKNAVRSAEQYLSIQGFSRSGLIRQLSSDYGDGYSREDATTAVDSLNVDWRRQAERSAKQYLSIQGFSCRDLIRQLSSDAGNGYTQSQATYGAQQTSACQ
ncbi:MULTISPECIES: Ltp family lipoprotein [Salinivibrio]|uniref:Ltp family lipoprotein n=1 Tax=Salinivibrio TaxID=51366 RepID=UPI000E320981|nr:MULTISPECIES: Ltp family lipoprotein [Salinivibrio]WBA17460.1 Ltp family lipoprotein [Salinivibrio kushneri]